MRLVVPRFSTTKTALKRLTTNKDELVVPRFSAAATALKRLTTNGLEEW